MVIVEFILLIIGMVLLVLSFLLPEEEKGKESTADTRKQIKDMVASEMDQIKGQVSDVVSEAMDYAVEKTERALEKISNEKIMAVSDYSETVLQDIHKNHEEAMFLYDVLNAKHTNLKEAAQEVDQKVKEAEEASNVAKQATRDAQVATQVASTVMPVFKFLDDLPKVEPQESILGMDSIQSDESEVASTEEKEEAFKEEDSQDDYKRIKELSEAGLSAVEIAKELGKGVGEVELILRFY